MRPTRKSLRKIHAKRGLPPATLAYTGERKVDHASLTLIEYNEKQFTERPLRHEAPEIAPPPPGLVRWLNLEGLHDVPLVEQLGHAFAIHPLALEDTLHVDQRPKLDDYEHYYYIVAYMIRLDETQQSIEQEQVSFVLGPNWLLSFQEGKTGDSFELAREHLRKSKGRLRKSGADYLLYALLDAMVDQYFDVLEKLGEWLEDLEDELIEHPDSKLVQRIYHIKREMLTLRRAIWPLREVINALTKNESELVTASTVLYLRDLYDHTIQVIDTVETYRDVLSGMLDIYLSSLSNRMNEIMKVLTMIATVFIPITFVAGVYGMNFDHMPELHTKYGYAAVWALMILMAGVMVYYFRRKRWI
jgi:magnesium transporter